MCAGYEAREHYNGTYYNIVELYIKIMHIL